MNNIKDKLLKSAIVFTFLLSLKLIVVVVSGSLETKGINFLFYGAIVIAIFLLLIQILGIITNIFNKNSNCVEFNIDYIVNLLLIATGSFIIALI